jgi:hypothetical protein
VVLRLRSSHDQFAGDALKRRALYQRHCQGSTHRSDGRRDNAAERMRASRRTATIFPTGGVISVLRDQGGPAGGSWSLVWLEA